MPKSKDIAKYIRENNIDAKSIILMLEKYKAIALLPSLLKNLKYLNRLEYPVTVIELAKNDSTFLEKNEDIDIDNNMIKSIEDKFLEKNEAKTIIENKQIVGGFRIIKNYKLYDYSVGGYLGRLFS